jgi:phosphatidylethanolamine/phosphatidyl-N-methylethanolamine N-methyltransferase
MSEPKLKQHTTDDFGHFLKSWIQNPFAIGAVAPSGKPLARLMATGLHPGARVIELGAGTGTLTEAILDRGVRPEDLFVVEQNAKFVKILARRFPRCPIIAADATELVEHVPADRASFDFVISGLPLLFFSPPQKRKLLTQAFELLGPGGVLHQFTYAGRCPVEREVRACLKLESSLLGIAPINLPPAFVYRLARA